MKDKDIEKKGNSSYTHERLQQALQQESKLFEEYYLWLQEHMPATFFDEFDHSQLMTIAHNLMGFDQQGKFIQIHFDACSIVLCEDSPNADLKILKHYTYFGIQNYQTFISDEPPPGHDHKRKLRIAIIHFSKIIEEGKGSDSIAEALKEESYKELVTFHPDLTKEDLNDILNGINSRFLRALTKERLVHTLHMYIRSKTRDHLQYEVRFNKEWDKGEKEIPSMQIVFAWKNTQKYNFLYRLAKLIHRHNLVMKRVNAAYLHPYSDKNTILMSLAIHGQENRAAWDVTDVKDFLQELSTLKYFEDRDQVEQIFVATELISGNMANFLRTLIDMTHQLLLHDDINMYALEKVEEGICRHPEITVQLCKLFEKRFDPEGKNRENYEVERDELLKLVAKIDTGNLVIDTRRKNILRQAINVINCIDKTNFYRNNKSSIAFRFGPRLLETLHYDRTEKFPELPYGIFFLKGKSFIGFQIRFKDLARGGIRTVIPQRIEQASWERNNIFSECYNLAYTQQKKNKDIPEGGSKAVIFVEMLEDLKLEEQIYEKELLLAKMSEEEAKHRVDEYVTGLKSAFLYQAQRSFIYSILTLVNCNDDGALKARDIIDYYKKPEYLYFGPDENMHNSMIEWIAEHSKITGYKPGTAVISSKPATGINHKEFGVTSLTVNVYMHKILEYLGIDPTKEKFTVKISGGPDGDVAGNQMFNLYRFYRNTAKLLAITDVSGTMYDPEGVDLDEIVKLFKEGKPIHHYPNEKLSDGGFHLDMWTKRDQSTYQQQTACYRKVKGKLEVDWMVGNDTHYLYSHNLHQIPVDVFIPGGGRPRTLNENNWKDYLDPVGDPTSKAIVEGANLYLTTEARSKLEEKGVLVVKDSSANKGGVICSSLEVLSGLLTTEEEFVTNKAKIMPEVLDFIRNKASSEADLLIESHKTLKMPMTEISEIISKKINTYTYQILDYLTEIELSMDIHHPLNQCLVEYVPNYFKQNCLDHLLTNIPDIHKKAIIACHIASHMVYSKGIKWSPSIVDILPLIIEED